MHAWFGLLMGCAILLFMVGGCGPRALPEDLSQIVFEGPDVPGADKPYDMPELGPPPLRSESNEPGLPPFPR